MKPNSSLFLAALVSLALAHAARAEWHVWTLTETRHVLRSDPPATGGSVKLGAARNEWVSFQILLRSDEPLDGVSVEPGDLQGPRGFLLRRADARLYRQHQLHLEVGTYRNDSFKPDWYPDPLIPFRNPLTGKKLEGARFAAVPFDLPAGQTHGFWVDLCVPTNALPGDYRGVYRVTAGGGSAREIPVSLTVWDFALPQTPTLVTEFGTPRLQDYYRQRAKVGNEPEPSDWAAVEAQCAQLLSEHRFNATPPRELLVPRPQPDGSFEIPPRQVQALREFVDRYHVNALLTPHPSSAVQEPETQRDTLRAWLAAFDRAAKELDRPHVLFYTYLKDEPNTLEDYRYVQKWGRAVRDAKSVVKVLVVEQPWTEPGYGGADSAWGDLFGAVDIWCPLFSLHRQESAARRQALGETIWTYTALCQGPPTPWWHIDFPLLNYRVPAWMAWRDGMKGLLYWGGMSYWRQSEDPWTQAPFYTGSGRPQQGRKGIVFNGEGSLVYPARAAGYDGVVPTIRLKALRDASQDYEYLALLQRLGQAAEAQQVVRSLTQTFFQWEKDPAAYEQARARLAAMIVAAAGHPSPLLPRPQEVRYQDGELPLHGLSIQFAAPPDAGDRFAAGLLASGLSARAKTAIAIRETKAAGPAILLGRNGEGPPVPVDNETAGPESRESFSIKTTPQGAELRARSSAGLFYAAQTLLQMVEGEGEQARLPAAEIRDWPALAYRGFMMDLSHGQLLRVSEIERQIDLLARFKANQYYFYSEASIELEGYEPVNPDACYTREQVRHIIDYARQRHVEVVPCLELYAHLHDLFRVEKFADLGLPRYGDEFDPRNPRVLGLIDDWVDQTANLFPSPWCHVGFDEPWALGKIGMEPGKDPFKTYIGVLSHVAQRARSHGKHLLFWADILQGAGTLSNHPELIRELPAGVIAVPWIYEAGTNYAPHLQPLAEAGVPTVVAPGVWNWNEIFPDYHRSFININGLAATGRKFRALGILNTGWTDSAQTLYRQSLPGLVLGAAAGWQSEAVDTNTFFADYAAQMYPPAVAAQVARALEELSAVEEMFESILQDSTQHALWRDPLDRAHLARLEKNQDRLRQARLMAESALEHLLRARRTAPEDATLNSLVLAARLFDYLGMKSLYAVEWSGYFRELKKNPDPKLVTLYIDMQMNAQDHGMLADLTDAASGLREHYRQAWLDESTPYRLGTALARWDAETQYWLSTWRNVNELLRTRSKDEPFPSIDVLRPRR